MLLLPAVGVSVSSVPWVASDSEKGDQKFLLERKQLVKQLEKATPKRFSSYYYILRINV